MAGDRARSCCEGVVGTVLTTLPRRPRRPLVDTSSGKEPETLLPDDAVVAAWAGVVCRLVVLVLVFVMEAVATVLHSSRMVIVFIEPKRVPSRAVTVPVRHTSIEWTGVAFGSSRWICPRIDSPGAMTGAERTRLPMVSCKDMRNCGVRDVLYFGGGG